MFASIVIFLHSLIRWFAVLAGLHAVVTAFRGMSSGAEYTSKDRRANVIFVAVMHMNALIGLMLFAFLSPTTQGAFQDMGTAMKTSAIRFFVAEHPVGMTLAVIIVTVGSVLAKKASTDAAKFKRSLIFMGLAFTIMMLSIPWPFYPAARSLLSLPQF